MPIIPFDVAGPGIVVLAGLGLGFGLVWYLGVVLVEAIVLTIMHWARFWRSLLASLLMNTVTTLVGLLVVGGALLGQRALLWLLFAFVLSVIMEWGVLALLDRPHARRAVLVSLVANLVSYVPAFLLLWSFLG
jgi:hypothetical protein